MVILITAHKAAQFHLAGQKPLVRDLDGFRAKHDHTILIRANGICGLHQSLPTLNIHLADAALHPGGPSLQEVRLADKVGHELIARVIVDLHGFTALCDDALVHDDDPVADGHGLALVMGHIDGRNAQRLLDAADLRAHGHAQLGVQV